jgi:hypothetical protein
MPDDDLDLTPKPEGGVESKPQEPAPGTEPGGTPQPEEDPAYEAWVKEQEAKETIVEHVTDEDQA